MPGYIGALTMIGLIGLVVTRVLMLKRAGIQAMKFGETDKSDFFILPFALLYFYLVFAAAFNLPSLSTQEFFPYEAVAWGGVCLCLAGLAVLFLSLTAFGTSFRVGIDTQQPDRLVTDGIFAYSRNPIYVAFGLVLLGQFLIFSNWILLIYLSAAVQLFHRQVLREESYLKQHYGDEYKAYCQRVRRYF